MPRQVVLLITLSVFWWVAAAGSSAGGAAAEYLLVKLEKKSDRAENRILESVNDDDPDDMGYGDQEAEEEEDLFK